MKLVQLQRTSRPLRALTLLPVGLLVAMLISVMTLADGPIASSNFVGAENPLSENGAWVSLMAYSPYGTLFQKNNGAYADRLSLLNHAASRTTAAVPADHYSEIVVGHIENSENTVGAIARVQTSGAATDSTYLWWASVINGANYLYRLDSNVPDSTRGTTYTAVALTPTSPVVDGDRLRLIARGQVIYGLKNGVRDFIYNTGTDPTKYSTGTTGIMAFANGAVTNAVIASWSTGPAPVSSGTWASSSFAGTENPLDEGDRWYPLPGYDGFSKAGGQASGLNSSSQNASGVWSITPPATQYSEVTLGAVASGGGGPIVRIDRNNPGQTGWLLFLYADNPNSSGIYKMTPDGNFSAVQLFAPVIVAGDKWRLTANGNTLNVYRNGVIQFTYTTDGSYATGDVGIEAFTSAFTFSGWQGGDTAGQTAPAPTVNSVSPNSGPTSGGTGVTITGTNFGAGATVSLGGSAATGVTVVNSTTITAIAPAQAAGSVNITVTNTDGQSGTIPAGFTYVLPAPTVGSVTPVSGPTTGGTPITISGTNFVAGATVTLGGSAATAVTVVNSTSITATTPAGAIGAVSVAVTNSDGQRASLVNAFTYTAPLPPPTVSSVSPNTGAASGGTAVTITGTNFSAGATVSLGASGATGVTVVNGTTITATTPAGAVGIVSVAVTNSDGQRATLANAFTYVLPAPTVGSVTPVSGPTTGGTPITISGTNFVAGATVTLGGSAATAVTVVNSTSITATTPAGAIGAVSVAVTNSDGQRASLVNAFTYTAPLPPPTVSSVSPNTGAASGGTAVTITGTNFSAGATVSLGASGATGVTVVNGTTITATTPVGAVGIVSVAVTNSDGQRATLANAFTYVLPAPTVGSVTPVSGPTTGGTPITISGTNFVAGATVTLGGSAATAVTVVNSTSITATTPAGAIGAVSVAVTNSDGQRASLVNAFTYTAPLPPPTVSSVSPNTGAASGGTAVTITGTNFSAGATVSLGASGATGVTVVNGTTITATTPVGAVGTVSVAVTNSDGQTASLGNGFVYTVPIPAPTVSGVSPNTGPASGGTAVTITGTNFLAGATVSLGASAATGVTVVNSTTITATTPAGTVGTVSVGLTNGDGQNASLTNGFTYTASNQPPPLGSSNFVGAENPLSENGTWLTMTSYSPYGTQFQKNNGAYADRLSLTNHAASRTTAAVPADHYSEIVVGHIGSVDNNVGPIARVQASGAATDSTYLWWASIANGVTYLYRLDSNVPDTTRGTTYTATPLTPTSPVVNGDRLRLIARGQVIYGLKNGVRDFIYNTGTDPTKYSTGTTGVMAYANGAVTNAVIASWSTGLAPVSSGTWASSSFTGTENPLDEGDRWYPLPGYAGFRKAGGQAIGLGSSHNASGVWSITPPATQYSEVTLGAVASGGGGPIVRIDRNNPGQTGWLLFLYANNPSSSGIYKMTPDGNFSAVQLFTPTIVAGDKWRLTANGNTLIVYRNGVIQITYTTDGSYATGDVGIEAFTSAFTFSGWQGGDTAGQTEPAPTVNSVSPNSGPTSGGTGVTITGTNFGAGATVGLGGSAATGVTVVNSTRITATTPAQAAGSVNITVTNTDGQSGTIPAGFTYVLPAPTIGSVTPVSGPTTGGTPITISGTNFVAGATVTLGGSAATAVTVVNSTTITATTPAHAAGTVSVMVTNPDGQSRTRASGFTYIVPPTLVSITPNSGLRGTAVPVTLTGTDFTATGNKVAVSGTGVTVGTITVVNSTTITATFTIAATATISLRTVSVTTAGGTSNTQTFTVLGPSLTSIAPSTGALGTSVAVTLIGSGLTGATTIAVAGGGIAVSNVAVVNDTTVSATFTITASAGLTARNVSVTTATGGTSNAVTFTVVLPPVPTLISVAPNSGVRGTAVPLTLTGTDFTATGTRVAVSGTGVTVGTITVVDSTTITATFTIAATAGLTARNVSVTTPGGTSNTQTFTVLGPTLSSVTPNPVTHGAGILLTLTGTNLAGATAVTVSGTGNSCAVSASTSTTVNATCTLTVGADTVRVTTPIGATGTVPLTVN